MNRILQKNVNDIAIQIEELVGRYDKVKHIAAISPNRFTGYSCGRNRAKDQFTYKPPQIAIYLNLRIRSSSYCPELHG